jgi:DNA processing protein
MESDNLNDFYWYWLCSIPGVSRVKQRSLLSEFGDAKKIYSQEITARNAPYGLSQNDLLNIENSKRDRQVYEEYCALQTKNIKFVHIGAADFPKKLKIIPDPPIGLFVKGRLPDDEVISVAIVGARSCSEYGRSIAYTLGKRFAYMGIQVVSGMALGIDASGQLGCVDGGGDSYAVLGGGVDVCYPRENIGLYTTLTRKGGVISEYLPGFNPRKGTFPERNRLISGLADIVIVVEARKKSGSLITVDHALEQNKEVMAVPGRVNEPLSAGCNELIKSGAMMITCAEDIRNADAVQRWVERYADSEKNNLGTRQSQCNDDIENDLQVNLETNPLASVKNLVYSTTNLYPKDIDTIISESGLDISVVSEQLFELQLSGAIKEVGKNCYVRSGL